MRLEALSKGHSQGMFELWSHAEVCRYSGPAVDAAGLPIDLPARSRSDSDRLLEFWLDRAASGTGFRWAARFGDDDEFAGAVGFNALGPCSEYAYHFVPRFWGRGLAAEASRLAIDWAFAGGAESIECFIEPANLASRRLAERLGFRPCGVHDADVPRHLLVRGAGA